MNLSAKTILFDINFILNKIRVEERQRVAELGCGNFGYFVFPLAKTVGKRGLVYAVDIMKPTLSEIENKAREEKLGQIKTVWSDLELFKATNIESNSLDRALLVNVLNQSQRRADILKESVRMLKPDGKLLIIEWGAQEAPIGPQASNKVKREAIKEACPKLGLKFEDEFEAGPYHYGLILKKL
jgi:ubiquinone/menaquinone biosynthesis C-methylase UbiE